MNPDEIQHLRALLNDPVLIKAIVRAKPLHQRGLYEKDHQQSYANAYHDGFDNFPSALQALTALPESQDATTIGEHPDFNTK